AEMRRSALVPLQALFFMNHPLVREQAEGFARRLIAASADPRQRIAQAHQLAFARGARPEEVDRAISYVERYADELRRAGTPTERLELEVWSSYARVVLSANEFVFVD